MLKQVLFHIKVYRNSVTGEVVMAPKGTSSLGDVATDIKMTLDIRTNDLKMLKTN
jgi:hypothetical protein